ncbi:MAG: MBL fold hydrolase [Chloroflexi bacterium RBG_16_50_11]|nr:MAG: MBL fold hydrolase [Chloroflexi bacterium RBG_16_50_11]
MDINLTFMGAARGVTGSRYLIETNNTTILVDCGLYQEREFLHRNWEPFRCSPKKLEAVFLTHAHLDHSGLLPKLVNEGFRGRVYCTPATADVTKIMLLDSAHLQEEDAAYKKKRHIREGRKGPYPEIPLYTVADAEATFPLFTTVEYDQTINIGYGIEATFYDAGHVLGSSMIKLRISQGGEKRSIIFSGDIGRWNRPLLEDPSVFRYTDYIVMESTYGDRKHEGTEEIGDELADIVKAAFAAGGNIIVPSFALQRAQEILYYLNILQMEKRIPIIDVYLDSPMAIKITEVYKRYAELFDREMKELIRQRRSPFDFPGLKMVETVEESKTLNETKGTVMIIAGAGMCTGGRIKHHLVNNISRPECTVLFVGYQAAGTLGRQILDGAKSVRIHGQQRPVNARIAQIQGFSAHADRDELMKWLSKLSVHPRHIFITHGETNSSEQFSKFLSATTGYKTSVPDYGTAVNLE